METPDNYHPEVNSTMEHTPSRQFLELATTVLDIHQPRDLDSPNRGQCIGWVISNTRYVLRGYTDVHDMNKSGVMFHVYSRQNFYEQFKRTHVYMLEIDGREVGDVKKLSVDHKTGDFVIAHADESIAMEAITVLSKLNPKASFNILQKGYDAKFPSIVGSFVLSRSELSEGKAEFIDQPDEVSVDEAIEAFNKSLRQMSNEAFEATKELYEDSDPATIERKARMVWRAFESRPSSEPHRTFTDVDAKDAAVSVALDNILSSSLETE
jgi:hypothetical protein